MTQEDAGTVNLFYCTFADNHSARGAAVYTRTNQLNVVGCQFSDNSASEWVSFMCDVWCYASLALMTFHSKTKGGSHLLRKGRGALYRELNILAKRWNG
jgi:hypothetical protein